MAHETLLQLATAILLFPLIGFMILIFLGKRIGKPAGVIGSTILGIDLLMAIVVAYSKLVTYSGERIIQTKFEWFRLTESISLTVGIGIDNLTVIMLLVVTLISFLVHMFSTEYMDGDKRYPRFYAYLGLFTFSMLGIVLANNFLFMYIFWELVGISSYLLIGFWYEKDSAANASKKAFITNRIGDFGFLMGILIIYTTYGSFMFDDVFAQMARGVIPFDNETSLTIAGMCIFCGAIGKSAQFPLHVWLPDAMEGPTPVSALIHAATMVAAGVYLVARVFPMFTADALTLIAYIGAITAFIAATIALTQTDFKKVLAYSTVSQLGYMVMALGVGSYTNGFFHLITHAWFKAALFLGSGSVIHAMHHAAHHMNDHHTDPQDINNMGGLRKTMPWTYITFLFATIAISGVPFTSGFLSKDGILAGTLAYAKLTGHWFIPFAGFGAAGLTAFYMFRIYLVTFWGEHRSDHAHHAHEIPAVMSIPLIILAVLSVIAGYVPMAQFVSIGAEHHGHHGINFAIAIPATIAALIGTGTAIFLYTGNNGYAAAIATSLGGVYRVIKRKFLIDELYLFVTHKIIFRYVSRPIAWFDRIVVDGGVNVSAWATRALGHLFSWLQTGQVQGYGAWYAGGALVVLLLLWAALI